MHLPLTAWVPFTRRDLFVAVALYAAALAVFWYSPVTVLGDSRYTLLVTQTLLNRGSFALDGYDLPLPPNGLSHDSVNYQIELRNGHLYYYFPPGGSILSTPFVLAQDALGLSVVGPDGSYSALREERDQHFIAAALMAALAVTFYLTARLLLPGGWSLLIALGGTLGTQVWSTASRTLWNHTWGITLTGCAIYLLLSREIGRRARLPPVMLATLLAWSYFVRPTNSVCILGVTIYLLCFHRQGFVRYALTGAAWGVAFTWYSWHHFGRLLPSYYSAGRLQTATLAEALAGNLISPSRGLLIFVPVALFVAGLPLCFWRYRRHTRLLGLATGISGCHYAVVSGFVPWYGGGCYGPRYTTELAPWLVLTAILGVAAALRWREDYRVRHNLRTWRRSLAVGGALLAWSVLVNGHGATDTSTQSWNQFPRTVDEQPVRVWDWRSPQFLAGIIPPPLPRVFPVLPTGHRVEFGEERGRAFQYEGWRASDPESCWTAEHRASLIFGVDHPTPRWLRLRFGSMVQPPVVPRQRVIIHLNDQRLGKLIAVEADPQDYFLPLPAGALRADRNFLNFSLPDAAVPAALGLSIDDRALGISLQWIEMTDVDPTPAPAPSPAP